MKKRFIIPTVLVGMLGGYAISQVDMFGTAQEATSVTAAEAKKLALQTVKGQITEFEYDRDDRAPHYDIEIKNDTEKVELVVDAISGAALITERETIRTDETTTQSEDDKKAVTATPSEVQQQVTTVDTQKQLSQSDTITKAQAIAIAQQRATGTVVAATFDEDDYEYNIELKNGQTEYEFDIHASTGAILSFETDIND